MVQASITQNKVYLKWSEFDELINKLADSLKPLGFKSIFGIKRGGYVPAVILSHKLGIDFVDESSIDENTLIVDEIVDSGNTLKDIRKDYPGSKVACVDFRKTSSLKPDFYVRILENDDWIVYPWEH